MIITQNQTIPLSECSFRVHESHFNSEIYFTVGTPYPLALYNMFTNRKGFVTYLKALCNFLFVFILNITICFSRLKLLPTCPPIWGPNLSFGGELQNDRSIYVQLAHTRAQSTQLLHFNLTTSHRYRLFH